MQNTKEKEQKNYRYQRCGGLWKKQTADGRGYLSGRITFVDEFGVSKDYSISVWPNKTKVAGDTKFDYTIDYDTQNIKNSPGRKVPPGGAESTGLAELPKSSVAAQNKAEQLLGNPFEKEAVDKLI